MKKILFIVGPTASGKTKLAFSLSSVFPSVLLNADSIQVYKGLDIISGKDIPQSSKFHKEKNKKIDKKYSIGYYPIGGTHFFVLDLIDTSYNFSIYDYLTVAVPLINRIAAEKKLPIIVGGTGFYIKALLDGIETTEIPPNEALREELGRLTVSELQILLTREDPEKLQRMNASDLNNKRRLIRAIEVVRSVKMYNNHNSLKLEEYDPLFIGLTAPRHVIKKNIDERVKKRIKTGAIEEARKLFTRYNNLSNQVKTASGYKQLFDYLLSKISLDKAIEEWRRSEYLVAKKQMTWFKKDKRIIWFDTTKRDFEEKVIEYVQNWYNN